MKRARHWSFVVLTSLIAACSAFGGGDDDDDSPKRPPANTQTDGAAIDQSASPEDAGGGSSGDDTDSAVPPGTCDPFGELATVVPLGSLNTDGGDQGHATLTADELEIYYGNQFKADTHTYVRILHSTRTSKDAPFEQKGDFTGIFSGFQTNATTQYCAYPWVSPDGTLLLFSYLVKDGTQLQLYASSRATRSDNFPGPAAIPAVNSASSDGNPSIGNLTKRLYFERSAAGSSTLFTAEHKEGGAPLAFATPAKLMSSTGAVLGKAAVVSADEKFIYYAKKNPDDFQIVVARLNPTTGMLVGDPHVFAAKDTLNGQPQSQPSWVSADHCRLYFSAGDDGKPSIYLATREPVK